MRHRQIRMKLRGTRSHARAMFSNMISGLVEHGRIQTTEKRARLVRMVAERLVTQATRLGDLLLKDRAKLGAEDQARLIHAMRLVRRQLRRRESVLQLFNEVAPRFLGRPGGYTRIVKMAPRKGDNAPMAILEFVDAPMPARESDKPEAGSEPKKGRLASLLKRPKAKDDAAATKTAKPARVKKTKSDKE